MILWLLPLLLLATAAMKRNFVTCRRRKLAVSVLSAAASIQRGQMINIFFIDSPQETPPSSSGCYLSEHATGWKWRVAPKFFFLDSLASVFSSTWDYSASSKRLGTIWFDPYQLGDSPTPLFRALFQPLLRLFFSGNLVVGGVGGGRGGGDSVSNIAAFTYLIDYPIPPLLSLERDSWGFFARIQILDGRRILEI